MEASNMIRFLAMILASIFIFVSLFHGYWASGGSFGSGAAVPTVDGDRLFDPSPFGTLAVAAALLLAALVVLGRVGSWGQSVPPWAFRFGTYCLSFVFAVRAIGDLEYVGFFKIVLGTDFARWDTWLYSPICLFIAAAAFLISFNEA
jgi:hypothetical protein